MGKRIKTEIEKMMDAERSRLYREKNHEKTLQHKREYYYKNKEAVQERNRKWYYKNLEFCYFKNKEYYRLNKQKILDCNARWIKKRKAIDESLRIKLRLRTSLRHVFELYIGERKRWKASKYGIDYKPIVEHLKKTCPPISELHKYHIHHIKPLSYFDFTDPKQIIEAYNPNNLKWLTVEENLRLRDKWQES